MAENQTTTPLEAFTLETDKETGKVTLIDLKYITLEKVVLPDNIDIIGEGAFCLKSKLKTVILNSGLTSIEGFAFWGCEGLESIEIPSSVTSIGDEAFRCCECLKSIIIPSSVTSIGHEAFYGCSGLTSIEIPSSVTSIGKGAFYGCTGLKSLTVDESNEKYKAINNCLIEAKTNTLVMGCETSVIPSSVTSIGHEAFYGCTGLTSITIPSSVIKICDSAFWGCESLTSIEIPSSVTSIGEWAFESCSGLASVTLPNSLISIGECAFANCRRLKSIAIPPSVTTIGESAFWACGLTSIDIPSSVTLIDRCAFGECARLRKVIYRGTKEQWKNIIIGCENDELLFYPQIEFKGEDSGRIGKFEIEKCEWVRKPKDVTVNGDKLEIVTEPHTDLWQRTYYGFRNDNAPVLQMATDEMFFSFSVKTEFESKRRFDQCGIAVYLDSDNWLKASVEFENDEFQRLGSVVTNNGYSDWATTDIPANIKTVWYRLSRRNSDFCVESSFDGVNFKQMRICHLTCGGGEIKFGVYACSPEDSSFKATFSEFHVGECVWKEHK